jgi:hypothetical protein
MAITSKQLMHSRSAGWGSFPRLTTLDPHPNLPPFRGREHTELVTQPSN